MILRKPYALIIKYFKVIHLLLTVLLTLLVFKFNNIVTFFTNVVSNGYVVSTETTVSNYINFFMYIAILIILAIGITIYMLFREKKKPTRYYAFLIVYYIIMFIYTTIVFGTISGLETTEASTEMLRSYRDISLIISLPQYFFVIIALIRGIGFDIKKFDFKKDIAELKIEDADNEEVEINIKVPGYKIKRFIRRFFRELKYFIIENKFISTCVGIIVLGIIITSVVLNRTVYSKTYKESQNISLSLWNVNIIESFVTPFDYKGSVLKKDKYYVILSMDVMNKQATSEKLPINDFRLQINKKDVFPVTSLNEYFVDVGVPYLAQKIKPGETKSFLLIYEIDKKNIQTNYTLKIQDQISYLEGNIVAKYKETILAPDKQLRIDDISDTELNDIIPLNYSTLGKSTLNMFNYSIMKSYKYNYEFCTISKCYTSTDVIDATYQTERNKTLIIFDYELFLDEKSPYLINVKDKSIFFNSFLTIKYITDNKEYLYKPINKSTPNLPNKLILEVYDEIKNASSIDLIFTIRNQKYILSVK